MTLLTLLIALQSTAREAETITVGGWIVMLSSVSFVTVLVIWCFAKVLSLPKEERDDVKDLHSA